MKRANLIDLTVILSVNVGSIIIEILHPSMNSGFIMTFIEKCTS